MEEGTHALHGMFFGSVYVKEPACVRVRQSDV